MTTAYERHRALKQSRKFLEELCSTHKTPEVPQYIRDMAKNLLRHYPDDYELDLIADECPELLDKVSFFDKIGMK